MALLQYHAPMNLKVIISCTLLALSLPIATNAAPEPAKDTSSNWGWGLYLDQDLWLPVFNEDRDYTMGIALEFFWQDEDKPFYLFDDSAKKVGEVVWSASQG